MTGPVPVVDIFAGCGGLSEGFAQLGGAEPLFDVSLALDSDPTATETHLLRSFFHQFNGSGAPDPYYEFLRGEISFSELTAMYPDEAGAAQSRVLEWKLGDEAHSDSELSEKISSAVDDRDDWVLIGGPPCQAYSIAGRARNRAKPGYTAAQDNRHFLYREYLKILGTHWPAVFVMENVPGILNSKVEGVPVWHRMMQDLVDPAAALGVDRGPAPEARRLFDGYHVYSLVTPDRGLNIFGEPTLTPQEYIVRCEQFGVPQTRHRVFILGVRADIDARPSQLEPHGSVVRSGSVLNGLPRLRSGISRVGDTRVDDSDKNWLEAVRRAGCADWWEGYDGDMAVRTEVEMSVARLTCPTSRRGASFEKKEAYLPAEASPRMVH
jgi:DNA (cytosine-5)-methyltransferase 1